MSSTFFIFFKIAYFCFSLPYKYNNTTSEGKTQYGKITKNAGQVLYTFHKTKIRHSVQKGAFGNLKNCALFLKISLDKPGQDVV